MADIQSGGKRVEVVMRHRGLVSIGLGTLAACAAPDHVAVDPFDTTILPRIQLTEQAIVASGTAVGEPVLHQVSGAVVLPSGEVAVVNLNSEILVFGADGSLQRTLGRSGGGPGEFRFLQAIVGLDNDRILAWDPAQNRVTVFKRDGALDYVRTPQGVDLARVERFVGAFGDGSFVLEGRPAGDGVRGVTEGLRSDTVPFLLFDPAGALVRTIGSFAPRARYFSPNTGYRRYLLDTSVQVALAEDVLLVGENDAIALERFDSSGAARSTLRLDRRPRAVTEPDVEAGWREWVDRHAAAREELFAQAAIMLDEAGLRSMRERIRADVEDDLAEARKTMEPAASLPAYESIKVGSDGALWLEDYLSPTLDVSRWILMGEGFQAAGWIELAPNEQLLAIGPRLVVILRKDDLGVESVVLQRGDWSTRDGTP